MVFNIIEVKCVRLIMKKIYARDNTENKMMEITTLWINNVNG